MGAEVRGGRSESSSVTNSCSQRKSKRKTTVRGKEEEKKLTLCERNNLKGNHQRHPYVIGKIIYSPTSVKAHYGIDGSKRFQKTLQMNQISSRCSEENPLEIRHHVS